jgi:hypothetical protein
MGTGWFFNPDEASLDLFWLRDEFDNLPDPDVLALAIIKNARRPRTVRR